MFIEINRNKSVPIKKQLYDALTLKFLNGEVEGGVKMPSTRRLAEDLNLSRNTVLEIYEQLIAEGYLYAARGSGTFVAENIAKRNVRKVIKDKTEKKNGSVSGISLVAGTPDLENFPLKAWEKALHSLLLRNETVLFDYGSYEGYQPLRESLCQYLANHKGIICESDQIIITSGAKDAMRILASALKPYFQSLLMESPCIDFIEGVFGYYSYRLLPCRVDNEGLVVDEIKEKTPSLIYTSPSHQFPLGGTLSVSRRQQLVTIADEFNHVILEDDYDSEFRYKGAPLNSIYLLNPERVIHIGTFSKTLSPSLRIGYMVVPYHFLKNIRGYFERIGNFPCTLNQAVLNELIINGSYEKHVYKMTRLYKAKMSLLVKRLREIFGKRISINGEYSGLHLAVIFKDVLFSELDLPCFRSGGVEVELLSCYDYGKKISETNTLIIGFGHLGFEEIENAVRRLFFIVEKLTN